MAHTAVCVPDCKAATAWYADVLGMTVLSPPYRMDGDALTADMGEIVPPPVVLKAAILGVPGDGDRVLEVIEYPDHRHAPGGDKGVTTPGFTHVGLVCDDIDAERSRLESAGVHFLTRRIADVAGLRTT